MNVIRTAIVLSHPTQYYSPWFRRLAREPDLEIKVFYLWDFGVKETLDPRFKSNFKWDVDLLSGYESEFVPNRSKHPGAENFFGFRNPDLPGRIREWNPDAILIFGYKWFSHLWLIAWSSLRGIPIIFRGDSHFLGRLKVGFLQRVLLGAVYGRMSAITYVGRENRAYFAAVGVPDKKLFFAPHSVNAEHFNPSLPGAQAAAAQLRLSLGATASTKIALFAGKFVADKRPLDLLNAFIEADLPDTMLILLGGGDQHDLIKARAEGVRNVHLLPFANQTEMPARYLAGDLFILPSKSFFETWGLAVNEAMHMGIPCLVSDRVGCQTDLVDDGVTGWVCKSDSQQSLVEKIKEAFTTLSNPVAAAAIKAAVAARISAYTYEQTTQGLVEAVHYSVRRTGA